jgi:hypothetical protein
VPGSADDNCAHLLSSFRHAKFPVKSPMKLEQRGGKEGSHFRQN